MRGDYLIAVWFAGALFLFHSPRFATAKIEEQVVAPPWEQGALFTLSPKGMHLASMHAKGSRFVVTLDGVEGEPFDQIFNSAVGVNIQKYPDGSIMWQRATCQGPVAFSPDGTRHAYAARVGQEVVVILDRQEVFRAPFSMAVTAASVLSFTPDSQHLFFYNQTSDTMQSVRPMMDGKPAITLFNGTPYPFFSSDGSRWGLLAGKPRAPDERFLVIDGQDASYVGQRPQFTPDGKHVVCVSGSRPHQALWVDGKPMVAGQFNDKFVISATGDIGAIVTVDNDGKKQRFINGKSVADHAVDVVFTPDGRHWAAHCGTSPAWWVVVDGEKQLEYAAVSDIAFTADSSKCIYVADTGVKRFVVVNGHEDDVNVLLHTKPFVSEAGNGFAYIAGQMMGKLKVYCNGTVGPVSYRLFKLELNPDGKHYAYDGGGDAISTRLIVDGVEQGPGPSPGGSDLVQRGLPAHRCCGEPGHLVRRTDDSIPRPTDGFHAGQSTPRSARKGFRC